jgi:hypothetical protein
MTTNAEALDIVRTMSDALDQRNAESMFLDRYYYGLHPMPWVHEKASDAYRKLLKQAVTNFPLMIVDSVADRLTVEGFRLGEQDADDMVWTDLWQRNNLDVYAPIVHTQALSTSVSYGSVWPSADGSRAIIRAESCYECYHDSEPGDPMNVRRALKKWADKIGKKWHGRLHLNTGEVFYLEAPYVDGQVSPDKWTVVNIVNNPFGEEVGIKPFLNRPQMDGTGRSELSDVLPVFDRINTLTADLLMASELAAFKIRWATGIDVPRDATTGEPVEPFEVAMDRLWVSENPEAKFGSFDGSPLQPYAEAIDQAIQQVAAITRTPPFLLLGKLTNLSAEALKATESGLVKKTQNRALSFGETWESLMRLGLTAVGDPRAEQAVDMETIWRDVENVSEAQRVDALAKLYNIGLPRKAVWERYGATPQEIARWEQMHAADMIERMAAAVSATGGAGLAQGPASANAQEPDAAGDERVQ